MNILQMAGSRDSKDNRYAPIFTNRFFMGMWTNRNTLRAPTGVIYESFYQIGGKDALLAGTNIEVSNKLTLIRRPGCTAGLSGILSSANIPDIIDSFYSFHEIGGTIRVFADTPTAPYLVTSSAVIPIFTKTAGVTQSFFQGVGQSLYFSDSKGERQKWLDFGAGNPGNSFATITNTSLTSNVATIVSQNNFATGQTVVISGTTNGAGVFNGTFVITSANSTQFQFSLTTSNVGAASDTGFANGTWNWQIFPPTAGPTINIVASGSAAVVWQASTVFSTMGLVFDSSTNSLQELINVNTTGGNNTQFGTSGNGEPVWSQVPGVTTTDSGVTWTNWGPIAAWGPGKTFRNNAVAPGSPTDNPAVIFDPTTGHMQVNARPSLLAGLTGFTYPHFTGVIGTYVWDGTVKWFDIGPPLRWKASNAYTQYSVGQTLATKAAAEPILPPSTTQTVYWQVVTTAGTSGASYTPAFSATQNTSVFDNQLTWISQGTATWAATTNYTAWSPQTAVFGAVKDDNGNAQVCVSSGTSGTTRPLPSWLANHAYALNFQIVDTTGFVQKVTTNGTSGVAKTLTNSVLTGGVATYTTSAAHGYTTGQQVTVVSSSHDATFNVVDAIITSTPLTTTFTVSIAHDDITTAADTGTSYGGPTWNTTPGGTTTDGGVTWTNQGAENSGGRPAGWGLAYGSKTPDGTVVWVNVGPPGTWGTGTIFHLPTAGFAPPTASQPFGGSEILFNSTVQAVTQTGKSGSSTPTFSATTGNFVLDPSTSNSQIIWQNVGAQQASSLSWTSGHSWVFAFKSRSITDLYSTQALGGGGVKLGLSAATPVPAIDQGTAPTGSADGSVSTASPSVTTTGSNSGAVVFLSGFGSTDPQVDTISIFRTADGGSTYFWVTDIANPPANSTGQAQPWTYADSIPDVATSTTTGLNQLVVAPISHQGDPPLSGAVNLVQHFGRIFYSVGATVYTSMGPLVGGPSQPPGNGYTSFNPAYFWTFPSPVMRLVPTPQGLLVFTASDLFIIAGGPLVTSLFAQMYIPGLGLANYNALTTTGGLIFCFTADNQVISIDPNMGVSKIGYPIGDQFSKFNGINSTFAPSTSYLSFHIQGLMDEALFVADGSTGWFRCNINQAPDSSISGPVWSPKANIVGGCKAIASLEVALGQHALLIGATSANHPILVRDSTFTTFSDNGTPYPANCTIGNIILANPGQLAELGFVTCEFVKTGTSPKLLTLMDELADTFISITAASQSGTTTTYTYTITSGVDVVAGITLTITGMADTGNNGTFLVNTGGGGTFTVTNANGVTRAAQSGTGTRFEDLSGYVSATTSLPPQDPPLIYGLVSSPTTNYSNRYYFAQSVGGGVPAFGTSCRYLQLKVDYGSTDTVMNELLTQTIWGAHWQEL